MEGLKERCKRTSPRGDVYVRGGGGLTIGYYACGSPNREDTKKTLLSDMIKPLITLAYRSPCPPGSP